MSFEEQLQSAMLAALAGLPGSNGVFLERPVRATPPYLVLGELLSGDWSAKGSTGREARLLVSVHDEGEIWVRTLALQRAVAGAVEALPRRLGDWSLGSLTLLRTRTAREGTGGWVGSVEYRVRAMEG